ncbi:hypothetical protein N0V93_009338 [Gnomoniopsis smithogilvyi]|uniref:Uncharacterized protein n=1 Tax=Gnomoniopsis smithogilvyi TaxID=1191159 RepID=A0A9W9CTL3_9PEZI|nr:hypothetical protein N0V93_009338 [Gnomoniopsis smithogilvyi]
MLNSHHVQNPPFTCVRSKDFFQKIFLTELDIKGTFYNRWQLCTMFQEEVNEFRSSDGTQNISDRKESQPTSWKWQLRRQRQRSLCTDAKLQCEYSADSSTFSMDGSSWVSCSSRHSHQSIRFKNCGHSHRERNQVNSRDTWKYHLKEIMDDNGCYEFSLSIYEYGLGSARLWTDVYVNTWKEYVDNVIKQPEISRELEEKAMAEIREGAAIMVPKLVWVAKKA